MPDHRTAERLLDILHQLESAVRGGRLGQAQTAAAPVSTNNDTIAELKAENARLHKRRKEALQRLDTLMEQLQQQLNLTTTEATQQENAA